jgi:aminopeptidase-like protein
MKKIGEFLINEIELSNHIQQLCEELFPICRSITGNGVRKSLDILKQVSEFDVSEIPSGTQCYDWTIPDEWNIEDAFIEDEQGNKIIDFQKNNLHVVNYSIPIDKWVSYEELESHLHTLENLPDAIPYRTSYYKRDWGFCLSFQDFCKLNKRKKFHVVINSTLKPGSLTYGEYNIKGNSGNEIIFSSYCCHPSIANDNMSGMVLWILLLKILKNLKLNHSYRFVLVPETIGAIAYLAKNEKKMKQVDGGFILTCVGGPSKFSYKPTFSENSFIDKIVHESFKEVNIDYTTYPFDVNGSDESQFSAPFFRIPVGTICKDKYYEFDYYHTSLDNLNFIESKNILDTLEIYLQVISKLEKTKKINTEVLKFTKTRRDSKNRTIESLNPYCEPMLSKRKLYPTVGGQIAQKAVNFTKAHRSRNYTNNNKQKYSGKFIDAISWVMFYGDNLTTIEEIAKKTGLTVELLNESTNILVEQGLIKVNE